MSIAADSLIVVMALDEAPERSAAAPAPSPEVRETHQELASIGLRRWGSPPPGLDGNWVYLTQLGLLLAVGVMLWGARVVGC